MTIFFIESNINDPVLLNLSNVLHKGIKCSASLAFYLFSLTFIINSTQALMYNHLCVNLIVD